MKLAAKIFSFFLTFCFLLFVPVKGHAAKGDEDYLEKMGVLRLKEDIEAPPFTLTDLEGKKVRLSDFRGKVMMLNFWATW